MAMILIFKRLFSENLVRKHERAVSAYIPVGALAADSGVESHGTESRP